jgi:hypothetical protein
LKTNTNEERKNKFLESVKNQIELSCLSDLYTERIYGKLGIFNKVSNSG